MTTERTNLGLEWLSSVSGRVELLSVSERTDVMHRDGISLLSCGNRFKDSIQERRANKDDGTGER
jgi:hypothetical protein